MTRAFSVKLVQCLLAFLIFCKCLKILCGLLVLQEAEYGSHDQIELYEDVISPSANKGDAPEDRDYMDNLATSVSDDVGKGSSSNSAFSYTGKRIALYIGNLTWVCRNV